MELHDPKPSLPPTTPAHPYERQRQFSCYFTIPSPGSPSLSSSESDGTPPSSPFVIPDSPPDPHFPLLAYRESDFRPAPPSAMNASKLLQLQTAAAYSSSRVRPKPQPLQDVLELSDDGSDDGKTSSSSSTSSASSSSSTPHSTSRRPSMQSEFVRCSRCKRTSSLGSLEQKTRFVSYGFNLYYCKNCAVMVGYGHG